MESLVLAAFALLVLGVIGTLVPFVPGGLLSLGGILVYWHAAAYQRPGALLVAILAATALLAVTVEYLAGAIGAKTAGASIRTAILASLVGIVGLLLGGPVGLLIGVVGTTYALEARERGHGERTLRVAVAAGIGVLASAAIQVVLTGSVLVVMTVVALGLV